MRRVAVALGSNLGDRLAHLRAGAARLERLGRVEAVSPLYETAPVGGPEQGAYLNAVVVIATDLDLPALLAALQEVEEERGRVRGERWGPRTLDLDIVAAEGEEVRRPDLVVPHPRAAERRFVLAPLADVWPEAPVGAGLTAVAALARLRGQEVSRWAGEWRSEAPRMGPAAGLWLAGQAGVLAGAVVTLAADARRRRWGGRTLVGSALLASGVGLAGWAAVTLGPELTPFPEPRPHPSLVDRGPYRHARHPVYGGISLGVTGAALAAGGPASLAAAAAVWGFLLAKSRAEERALAVGVDGYAGYRDRVRRRFLPLPW